MHFDLIINHDNKNLSVPRLDSINGIPSIEALTEYPVYRSTKEMADVQPASDKATLVYEVAIGDYICKQEYSNGTTYVSYYKIVDITDNEVIAEPV